MLKRLGSFVYQGVEAFIEDEALSRGAAIAFYAATALGPILFITVSIAGTVFGREAASGAVTRELARLLGPENAQFLHTVIAYGTTTPRGLLANLVGIAALVFTASGIFTEMHSALNTIWKMPSKRTLWWRMLRAQMVSIGLVAALGFMLLTSLVVSAASGSMGAELARLLPFSVGLLAVLNALISFLLVALLFAAIYKFLPDKDLQWRDVAAGALGTALLFEVGKFLIGVYLGSRAFATAYGAAGGLILILLWVYYSAQIFLLGAEFTKIYASRSGSQQQSSETLLPHAETSKAR